jgi:tRNA(Ile)-lysidine synthase
VTRAPAALRTVADAAARALAAAGVLAPGERVAAAVSGGADSLALLHALRTLAGPRGLEVAVVTVDHGLREASTHDAAFVAAHARELGLAVLVRRADPAVMERHLGDGPEAAARAARYEALLAAADELGCRWVATGHTQDDQAETVLLALLRGTGPDGLAGMATVTGRVLRPLLGVRRAQTEACCAALGLVPRRDETNDDERLLRNAVRRRVLPLLEELRPGATATLARGAALARDERDWAEQVTAATLASLRAGGDGAVDGAADGAVDGVVDGAVDGVRLDAAGLAALPVGLARRVVRAAAAAAGQSVPPAAAVDQVLALGHGDSARWPGGRARRDGDALDWPAGAGPS